MLGRAAKTAHYLRAAREGRYDVIDAWLYPVDVMAALARGLTRTPVVVTGRYNLRDFAPPMTPPERWLNDRANRMADAIVANAEAVAEDTRHHEIDRRSQASSHSERRRADRGPLARRDRRRPS